MRTDANANANADKKSFAVSSRIKGMADEWTIIVHLTSKLVREESWFVREEEELS